jgi:hypothetical protein
MVSGAAGNHLPGGAIPNSQPSSGRVGKAVPIRRKTTWANFSPRPGGVTRRRVEKSHTATPLPSSPSATQVVPGLMAVEMTGRAENRQSWNRASLWHRHR